VMRAVINIRFAWAIFMMVMSVSWVHSAEEVTDWAAGATPIVIQGGTLINVRDGQLTTNVDIVVNGDTIESVGRGGAIPAGAIILNATGKYIIPGLIDLHMHYKDWAGPLYLNHGVTTAVSLGDTHNWIRAQKAGIKAGTILGPRLFISTTNLDQTPKDFSNYFLRPYVHLLDDAEAAQEAMREYIAAGVDAVKVYVGLSIPQLKKIVAEANKANIPVLGHFDDVRVAIEVGAHGIEHNDAVAKILIDTKKQQEAMKRVRKGLELPAESFMDVSKIPEIVRLMVAEGIYLNPTMRMTWHSAAALREKGFQYEDFDLTYNDWNTRFIPTQWVLANLKEYQEIGMWNWRDLSEYEVELFEQGYRNAGQLIKAFADAGGKLYAGTDAANMAVPGLATHQEMELMVAAGVSPLVALQSATINSADLMRMSSRLGAVEVGKVGDLLILDGNPLEDIRNTRKIWRVVSRGEVLDGKYHGDYRNPITYTTPDDSSHFFPSPRVRTISPGTLKEVATSEGVTLTVTGTGFIPYSYVRWDGIILETEFVGRDELKAKVPDKLLKNVGTYAITVENPDFGWGTTFALGASDISHLGTQNYISNEIKVIVIE